MFRKAHVTGELAAIPGQDETGANMAGAIALDDDDDDASKKTPNLAKRLKFGGGEKESPFFRVYNNALNSLVSKADVGSSSAKDDDVPTTKEFLGMVRECGVSEGTDVMFTACKLAVKRENREVFAGLETSAGRLHYLKSMHDEMNK